MKKLIQKSLYGVFLAILSISIISCGGENQEESSMESGESEATATVTQADSTMAPEAKLNINTASEEALMQIPKVGENMYHEFEEYRPYSSILQFRKEIGKYVDESQVAAYEKYIYVPIHRNDSDAATLMQIPGLESSEAEELISGRPYDSNQAFLDALTSFVNEDQLAKAKSYMKSE